jgi:hypothetical protein
MVYRSLMKTARSSRIRLMPERYTADLAAELGRRDDDECASTLSWGGRGPPPPHVHAYRLWRQGHGLLDICIRMRDKTNPENETVVMYVHIRVSSTK